MDVGTSTQTYTLGDLPKCSGERNTPSSGENSAPVSACEPLCAIFLRKPSVYPLSLVKANVAVCAGGVENRMTNALESVGMAAFPALFTAFSRTKKKAG